MRSNVGPILILSLALFKVNLATAADGYHYDRPTLSHNEANTGGHYFGPLSTVSPLPPVPALPPLPTARPDAHVHTQTLVQVHPPPQTASKSIANAYRPQIQKNYLPPALQRTNYERPSAPGYTVSSVSSKQRFTPTLNLHSAQVAAEQQKRPSIYGQRTQTPSVRAAPAFSPAPSFTTGPAAAQPLRIPFGQQAIIHLGHANPEIGEVYNVGDRQVRQYAVIEIIDNDIEQDTRPFLKAPFIDNNRAQIGASGTGAEPPALGQQLGSRSSALLLAQQNLAQQRANNDAIALGSGGLGFVRLPNGNVYLGSGSLGYISSRQHSALVHEARTRSGAPVPDALHFGHGPLGILPSGRRYRF